MKDEKTIEKVRNYTWELVNKLAEVGDLHASVFFSTIGAVLDWVLEKKDWEIMKDLEEEALKKGK